MDADPRSPLGMVAAIEKLMEDQGRYHLEAFSAGIPWISDDFLWDVHVCLVFNGISMGFPWHFMWI